MDISATVKKDSFESTTHKGSSLLTGGNLIIKSGSTAKIEGSDAAAQGDILIDARNVEITAAKNTEKTHSTSYTEHLNYTASYATNNSWGINGDTSHTWSNSESESRVNSHLNANNITIKSIADTAVRGGMVAANTSLDLDVGGNLVVESLQNKSSSSSYSYGVNGGYSETRDKDNNKTGSGNGGANFSVSMSERKWVTEQTSLTGSHVNIYVEKKTTLTGAVIASTSNDLTLNTGSLEYSDIKDKDISWNGGLTGSYGKSYVTKSDGDNNDGDKSNSAKYNTWSASANYGYSEKRQTNFATIGEGTIIVRDGETDLSGLNRDVTKAQYGTVDIGLKGGFTVDSSTVALVTSPIKTISETYAALEKGYEDAAKTTEEIYEKSVVMYERTTNYINDKGFYTDKEIRINECIQMWNDDSKYGIGARLYEKYRGEILGDNFYRDSKAVTDLKLAYINLLGIDTAGSILGEVKGLRKGLYDNNNQQINGGGIIYLDLSAQERGNILAYSAINKEIKNGEIVNYMIKLQKEDYEKYVTLEQVKEAQYNKIVSLVVGISPLSPVKSALDIATGKDVITRDQLATSDYTLAASDILLLAAGPIGKIGKGLDAINDIAKMDRIVDAGKGVNAGDKVYRVWGGEAAPWGRSWTTVDPRTVSEYRNAAGLPNQNTGRFISEGILQNTDGILIKQADPLHGNKGGFPEAVIPNPQKQVILQKVEGLNPEF